MNKKYFLILTLLLVSSFFSFSQTLTDSLQAHYKFDGTLLDETNNNHNLTLDQGIETYNFVNINDSAVDFNGVSRITTISNFDNSSFTKVSVALWIKSTTITSNLQICLQGAFMGFGAYIEANTGKFIGFFDGSSSGSYISTNMITDGNWHHIVIQTTGTTTSMYIDGVFDGNISESLVVGNGGTNNKLFFGQSNLGVFPFTGALNDVRIYNRLLTAEEITRLSTSGTPVSVNDNRYLSNLTYTAYPNPSNGNFTIDLEKMHKNVTIEVLDISGQIVQQNSFSQLQLLPLSIKGNNGIYFLRINNGYNQKIIRIIKQ